MSTSDRLAVAQWEAERHARTLAEALGDWDSDPAPDWPALDADRKKVRLIDQLLLSACSQPPPTVQPAVVLLVD